VTNLRSSLFVVALSSSLGFAAACQKAPDVNKIQSQALLTVKSYAGQLEVLQRRADANLTKFRSMDQSLPGASEAGRRLGDARGKLEQLRALVTAAPTTLATAAKSGRSTDLQASIDNTNTALVDGTLEITADLTAFENWAAFAGPSARVTPPSTPPAAPAPATTEEKLGDRPPGTPVPPVTGTPPVAPVDGTPPVPPRPRESDGGAAKPAAPATKPPATRVPGAGPRQPAAAGSAAKP